jgi:hypothetical protein
MQNLSLEERRAKEAKWARDYRRRLRENKVPLVPAKPFVEWFLSLNGSTPTEDQMGDKVARAVRRAINGGSGSAADLESRRIRLDIVDEVGVLVGQPFLIHSLYAGL